jgi:hypothetical protein
MGQPARPDRARALSARDWPAPAHPQHRSPDRRRITTHCLTSQQPMTAASPAATGPMPTRSAATAARCHTPAAASALHLMPVTTRPPPR